jgi:uncharacterized membrane protein YfcA
MFDPITLILIGSIIFMASFVNGLCGFGFALVSVPFMMLFLPPKTVIPLITIISVALDATILLEARRHVEWRKVVSLMAPGIVGMLIGVWLLTYLGIGSLKLYIRVIILVFTLASMLGLRRDFENKRAATVFTGFLAGLLGGSSSIPGPPIVLFFQNQRMAKETFRANLIAFLLSLYVVTIPMYVVNGLITWELIMASIIFVPLLLLRAVVGIRFSHRIDEASFKKVVLVLVTLAGFMSILTGLGII